MALTIEQLSDLVEALQVKVSTLETTIKQYRQDISGLEQQLSEYIKTDKLVVTGEAEISGRSILADRELLTAHDGQLAEHDRKDVEHDGRLGAHDGSIAEHRGRLNSHDATLNAHQEKLNELLHRSQKITFDGASTVIEAGNNYFILQSDGNVVIYRGGGGALWATGTSN
jgi:chromosome segregation ATPase